MGGIERALLASLKLLELRPKAMLIQKMVLSKGITESYFNFYKTIIYLSFKISFYIK